MRAAAEVRRPRLRRERLIIAVTCMRWPQVGSDGCAQAGPHVAHGLCLALRPSLVRLAVRLIALPIRQARAA
ncbi:hypothetical protein XCV1167 [Xanthomonas euvesicatoria pv. vesicatoria str. 85-10]|uniref:Uncharacterized protein n=1 Tax=Xanthomonas euvesicatoria pv. vesicatoria (strain 85-10) TaxID=316273 RepID=Q3BWG5_XANE5|nr:hypothetical protein XCV1167 [Xanthomonas euvesicatoria pv. vesicatoria str. 85-10]